MPGRRNEEQEERLRTIQERVQEQIESTEGWKSASEVARRAAQAAILANLPGAILPPNLSDDLRKALAEAVVRGQKSAEEAEAQILQAAIEWIEDKWGGQSCPYCQHVEWQVGTPVEITALDGEVMSPAFPVMCGNCGHTTFVNAIKADLVPETSEDEA